MECSRCGKCCKSPKAKFRYSPDNLRFYRYHGLEGEVVGGFVEFAIGNDCQHLTAEGCSIYEDRPNICKDYYCKTGEKVKLSVFERLMLNDTLPAQGDITTIRIVRQLREDLSFSEEEHKQLKFQEEDGMVHWDEAVSIEKDVEIGDKAHEIIVKAFEQLSQKEAFTEAHLKVYDKFIE